MRTLVKFYSFEKEDGGSFTVKAESIQSCYKKIHKHICNEDYETKGRELKSITEGICTVTFHFCGRDIIFKFIDVRSIQS